jgi:hypothetical protein
MKKTKTFQFMLVLKQIDEKTPSFEDSLYEAGCDDALIHSRGNAVYLEFDREASSLEDAVISAIKNIQSASIDAEVASVAPENFVTESEIAKRLNTNRQTVSLWIKAKRRKSFPPPIMRLSEKSPLWNWSEVVRWLYANKIIKDKTLVQQAIFFANINAVLEERDRKTREIRHNLLDRLARTA